ncbi:hypothetical protein MA16_Dca016747 [Dendrobium catenatum]|uniref:Uncharacterized protein n=1 Tax=Dendrobium catenatum TaxID=906689 RepID=A0A2I0V9B7_9ASPA|nr:hypothetical protein MA16_Dca016747 [Dendrobium catenatum]
MREGEDGSFDKVFNGVIKNQPCTVKENCEEKCSQSEKLALVFGAPRSFCVGYECRWKGYAESDYLIPLLFLS